MKKTLLIAAAVAVITFAGASLGTQLGDASASTEFDHSQCQYPDRTTNPPNGCDNSDPCDPQSAVKGGSGECSDVKEPVVQPTTPVTAETSAPQNTSKPAPGCYK